MKRRKNSRGHRPPLIRLVGLEAAVAVSGVAGSLTAVAAPGDLDPSYGDVGRYTSTTPTGAALWSVDVQPDDAVVFAGGVDYCYYDHCEVEDFTSRLLPAGTPDASFAAATLEDTVVYDTLLQGDGKVVAVGKARQPGGSFKLQAFRLRPDGSLDPEFGIGGVALISDGTSMLESGHSVIVDAAGRIVIAGSRGSSLLVARMLPNGVLDPSFGTGGVFVPAVPAIFYGDTLVRLASAGDAGYRVLANVRHGPDGVICAVLAVTQAGATDASFGVNGVATVPDPGDGRVTCSSIAVQADGRVLLGGTRAGRDGYVGRMLANGSMDGAFSAPAAVGELASVSAIALGSGGSLFVAGGNGSGLSGAVVVRLLADGTLDTLFGRAGSTQIDLPASRPSFPVIADMKVLDNDRLVVAGNGYGQSYYNPLKFVARLLGNGAAGGPGVLSLKSTHGIATEGGQATVAVSRIGGSAGAVAVTYRARDMDAAPSARSGLDYTASTDRLTWADGDNSDREFTIPIAADAVAEQPEFFEVLLESPEGGAGLGAYGTDVEVAGDGYPAGQFSFASGFAQTREGTQSSFTVQRDFYATGAVSVTVRVVGGTAEAGRDFGSPANPSAWQDVVLSWPDGDASPRLVVIPTSLDKRDENAETVILEIASPTGGAALGVNKQATLTIANTPAPDGGGGSFGWLGAFLLGLWGACRRR